MKGFGFFMSVCFLIVGVLLFIIACCKDLAFPAPLIISMTAILMFAASAITLLLTHIIHTNAQD
jgi:hypothetical protein